MDNPLLQPSPGLMVWTLITFALAMFILKKLAFNKIQEALNARRQSIVDTIEQAERTREESREMFEQYKAQLATARSESDAIVERARKAADDLSNRMKAEADEQRQRALTETREQIDLELEKAIGQIRSTVADLTIEATEKITRGAIDTSSHAALIEQALGELDFDRLARPKAGARS